MGGKVPVDIVTSRGLVVASSRVLPDMSRRVELVIADDKAFTGLQGLSRIVNGRAQASWSAVVDVPRDMAPAKADALPDAPLR